MMRQRARAVAAQRIIRVAGPLGFGAICLMLLGDRLSGIEAQAVLSTLREVHPLQWLAALAATWVSFWAVGRYDAVVHGSLGTGIARREAMRAGAAAIALAQVLGLGVVTGALARWRMLPGLSAFDAARVSGAVALSFLAGWAVVAAAAELLLPSGIMPWAVALAILGLAAALAVLAVLRGEVRLRGRRIRLPSLPAMTTILGLTALDTIAAALALHSLLPAETAPGLAAILPAYLMALGAALLTGTPGGVGPFELALLTLLPQVPEADLLAGILGFRLVYYALPACLALIVLARPLPPRAADPGAGRLSPAPPAGIATAPRAELGIARQNGACGLAARGSEAAVVETGQAFVLLFAAAHGPLPPLLPALAALARDRTRVACAYKIAARDACLARQAGWRVARIADEAVLDLARFTFDHPARSQLRRKLRKAEKAGLTIRRAEALPLADMAAVDRSWTARHGTARGVTMGVFSPAYLRGQYVWLAERDGALVAFVTFHRGRTEWTLDLMRHGDTLPDGTMHALVAAAIAEAQAAGVPRLSLAALPAVPAGEGPLTARLRAAIARRGGGEGLTRFKTAFHPRRAPLYAAAPGPAALALALADLALSVHRPPPPAIAFAPAT